jgi:hypothetical protein
MGPTWTSTRTTIITYTRANLATTLPMRGISSYMLLILNLSKSKYTETQRELILLTTYFNFISYAQLTYRMKILSHMTLKEARASIVRELEEYYHKVEYADFHTHSHVHRKVEHRGKTHTLQHWNQQLVTGNRCHECHLHHHRTRAVICGRMGIEF